MPAAAYGRDAGQIGDARDGLIEIRPGVDEVIKHEVAHAHSPIAAAASLGTVVSPKAAKPKLSDLSRTLDS